MLMLTFWSKYCSHHVNEETLPHWGTEELSNLSKDAELASDGAKIWT